MEQTSKQNSRKMRPQEKKKALELMKRMQMRPLNRQESQREEIAPAQKEPKIQENQCLEASVPEGNDDEKEPIKEGIPEVEVVNEKYETRREHMSNLTIQELAHYLTGELGKYHLEEIAITTETRIHDWLSEKVDRYGERVEE